MQKNNKKYQFTKTHIIAKKSQLNQQMITYIGMITVDFKLN